MDVRLGHQPDDSSRAVPAPCGCNFERLDAVRRRHLAVPPAPASPHLTDFRVPRTEPPGYSGRSHRGRNNRDEDTMGTVDFETRVELAKSMGSRAGLALAAECGERVVPVYEQYWVGDLYPEVRRCVELGWEAALGSPADQTEVANCRDAAREILGFYHEEGYSILAAAVAVAAHIVGCIEARDADTRGLCVARALESALHTAILADNLLNGGKPNPEGPSATEEEEWQEKALTLARSESSTIARDMFEPAGPRPPAWWSTYRAGPRQI